MQKFVAISAFVFSSALCDPAAAQAPAAPSGGTSVYQSRTVLQIGWQDNSTNEDAFEIVIYQNGGLGASLGQVSANTTQVSITGLTPGATYQYAIFAYNSGFGYSSGTLVPPRRMPDWFDRFGHQVIAEQSFSVPLEFTDLLGLKTAVEVSGLPAWASFTEATSTLSGTAPAPGAYPVTVTVDYLDGFQLIETVTLRAIPAASGPVAGTAMPEPMLEPGGPVETIDLEDHFNDPDTPRAVRMTMTTGVFDIVLYEQATPATVANFLAYVNAVGQGSFDGAIVHRSVPGFVIQGGGYRPIGGSAFETVTDLAPVVNEAGLDNVRGTLSMAKQGGNPDSATNEWFVSLGDNRANLDYQNEGFSVFGRVAGLGMNTVDAIAAKPVGNYYQGVTIDGFPVSQDPANTTFGSCPMDAASAPATMEQDKLVAILSAAEVAALSYEVVSISDPAVATAVINGTELEITPLAAGTCVVTVRGTDLDGNPLERSLTVTVEWSFEDWAAAEDLMVGEDGPSDDPDLDRSDNLLEYGLFGDPLVAGGSMAEGQRVIDGDEYLAVAFSMRKGADDVVIRVESADSPEGTWGEVWNSSQGLMHAQVVSAVDEGDRTDLVVRDTVVLGSVGARFLRVRVVQL